MFEARINWLRESGNAELVRAGLRGLEKESLRIDHQGRLSRRPHPAVLGSALMHPYLTTDYSEALPEFVTPPVPTVADVLGWLERLHAFAHRNLDEEWLWSASMPCRLGADEQIPIAEYGTSNIGMMKNIYRRGLGHRYGRIMQSIAGVHFNYSPPLAFWAAYGEHLGVALSETALRSRELLSLARNYRRRAWLVTYLFGASPALDRSFRPGGHEMLRELDADTWYAPFATSLRMSDLGYRNSTQARLCICLNSLENYVSGLRDALMTSDPGYEAIGVKVDGEYRQLNAKVLQIENEHYSSVRPKPGKGTDLRPLLALQQNGVEYVEVRTLDLNPEAPAGVAAAQLRFLETLLVFCLLEDSPPIAPEEQHEIDARDLLVARAGRTPGLRLARDGGEIALQDWGLALLDRLAAVAEVLDDGGHEYAAAVEAQRAALESPEATLSGRFLAQLQHTGESFFQHTLAQAERYADYFRTMPYPPQQQAELAVVAAKSLVAQQQLEARDRDHPFDEFLAAYFAEI